MAWEKTLQRAAYGEPKRVKEVPGISDKVANVTFRLFQIMRARPLAYGIKKGAGRKRR
jgi:hypothetical protein